MEITKTKEKRKQNPNIPDLVPSVLPDGISLSRALSHGDPGRGHLPVQLAAPPQGAWCAAAILHPLLGGGFICRCACLPHEPLGNLDPISRISASQGPTGVWPIADPQHMFTLHHCRAQTENTWPMCTGLSGLPSLPSALSHPLCPATSPHQANKLIPAPGATGEPRQLAQGKIWNISSQFTCMFFSEVILSHHFLQNLSI